MTTISESTTMVGARVDESALRQIFLDARSNTSFAPRPVDIAAVREVWDSVKFGPTGNNNQPLRVAVAASEAARDAVIRAANPGNRARLEAAPLLLVAARDERFHDHLDITSPGSPGAYERLEAAPELRASMAHDNAMLQIGYLIVGLRAHGLALRPYGGFDRAALNESLLGGTSWRSELLLGVGYPADDDHGAGQRRGRIDSITAVREL